MTVGPTGVTLLNRKQRPDPADPGSSRAALRQRHAEPLQRTNDRPSPDEMKGRQRHPADGPQLRPRDDRPPGRHPRHHAAGVGPLPRQPYGGAFAVGNDDADVWGGLTGTEVGEAYGVGGLGLVGTGRGGGGTGEGTIGLGNTGLIGKGGGGGTGSGYGRGAGAGFGGRGRGPIPMVRQAKAEVKGALDKDIIRRIVRAHINEVRYCYNQALARDPNAQGPREDPVHDHRSDRQGALGGGPGDDDEETPRSAAASPTPSSRWTFPKPAKQRSVDRSATPSCSSPTTAAAAAASRPITPAERARLAGDPGPRSRRSRRSSATSSSAPSMRSASACSQWREQSPGDVLALLALGEALEAAKRPGEAARAYGSIIDLFPVRADLRRYAAVRLERLGRGGLELAIDTFAKAVAQRPDHPASHRLYAFALARPAATPRPSRRSSPAIAAYPVRPLRRRRPHPPRGRGMLAAAWLAATPPQKAVRAALSALGVTPTAPSLRFVLNWETDANDVDFHVIDRPRQASLVLQQDPRLRRRAVRRRDHRLRPRVLRHPGQGRAFPYTLQAHYYSRGPMGYGMGKLADLPARRQGPAPLRGAPLRHHEGRRLRRARHSRARSPTDPARPRRAPQARRSSRHARSSPRSPRHSRDPPRPWQPTAQPRRLAP
jgi:tetratricopeptide (TPR) repeat protein